MQTEQCKSQSSEVRYIRGTVVSLEPTESWKVFSSVVFAEVLISAKKDQNTWTKYTMSSEAAPSEHTGIKKSKTSIDWSVNLAWFVVFSKMKSHVTNGSGKDRRSSIWPGWRVCGYNLAIARCPSTYTKFLWYLGQILQSVCVFATCYFSPYAESTGPEKAKTINRDNTVIYMLGGAVDV